MAYSDTSKPLRVLLSEGSSTSAREAITCLALAGHVVDICDPDWHCLGRFSRLVRRFHRCPGLGVDPEGYLAFILDLVSREHFDVLLPIHEQGFLFAKVQHRLARHVGLALPSFASYERAQSKGGFSRLLSELGLPQPATRPIQSGGELRSIEQLPLVVKTAIGTASRGAWIIQGSEDLDLALKEMDMRGAFADEVLVQDFVEGPIEHAQAVFSRGRLIAMHVYRQIVRGAGGGPALKESVRRPLVCQHVAQLGRHLEWHGALSIDYILGRNDHPHYIDCNPRLVEPMNALLSGLDLPDLLVRVSRGEEPPQAPHDLQGIRSHLAMQALLGSALRDGSRLELIRECWRLLTKSGEYTGSREELTPLHWDWPSAIPTTITAIWLLANPRAARHLPTRGWGAHLLTADSARIIRERID
jgi:predicted ATP-grasp superfamily ATP-dependent carboligase